jgi:hypothetical protein
MLLTIKNLGKAERALIGLPVPPQQYGNVGKLVEDFLESLGYTINRGAGPDLLSIGVEIKTRTIGATSAQDIGTMTLEDIIKYDWDTSPLKAKFQQQFRVKHCPDQKCIVSAEMYDFRAEEIQAIVRYAYESARTLIINNCTDNYIRGADAWAYFEHKKSNSYGFRLPNEVMETFERMTTSNYKNLFETDTHQ